MPSRRRLTSSAWPTCGTSACRTETRTQHFRPCCRGDDGGDGGSPFRTRQTVTSSRTRGRSWWRNIGTLNWLRRRRGSRCCPWPAGTLQRRCASPEAGGSLTSFRGVASWLLQRVCGSGFESRPSSA